MSLVTSRLASPALLALVAALAWGLIPHSTSGQDQTSCPLESISLPLFDATPAEVVAATPAATTDTPEPTAEEIEAAAEVIVACSGEERQSVRFAVFTDRLIANQFLGDNPADQPAFERRIATGSAPEEWAFELDGISDIEPLPDGRVAVTLQISSPEETVTDRVVLAWDEESGAWLIDGFEWLDAPPEEE